MSEINLLMECLSTEGEAEDGGVKYIYMDDNTVYRFENNRMKKVSKSLITKAKKQLQSQNNLNQIKSEQPQQPDDSDEKVLQPTKPTKRKRKVEPEPIPEPYDDDEEEQEVEPIRVSHKRGRTTKVSTTPSRTKSERDFSSAIDLNEYYNNKNRMEFMNLEITRLNNKVDKLKHYKAIVNRLTGNEFDVDSSPTITQTAQSQPQHNDSLFLY